MHLAAGLNQHQKLHGHGSMVQHHHLASVTAKLLMPPYSQRAQRSVLRPLASCQLPAASSCNRLRQRASQQPTACAWPQVLAAYAPEAAKS